MIKNTVKEILNYFKKELNNEKPQILIVGVVGSVSPFNTHGDIDIFSILGQVEDDYCEIIDRHVKLISIINKVQKYFIEKGVCVGIFTEFRIEEISRYLLSKSNNYNKIILIHLKVYPNPLTINLWQSKAIAKNYFENVYEILYQYENNNCKDLINKIINSLPSPTKRERLEFLRMIIYETYEYIKLSILPVDFIELEAFNKLYYVTIYLSIELLNARNNLVLSKNKFEEIKSKSNKLPFVINNCIYLITENRNNNINPSVEELNKVFFDLQELIEHFIAEVSSDENTEKLY